MPQDLGTLWEVVRDVVADVAPDELDYVEGLKLLDERIVSREMRKRGDRSEPLGFGPADIVLLVAPVIWIVVEHAAKGATDSLVDRAVEWAKEKTGQRRTKTRVPVEVRLRLTDIHRHAMEEAVRRGESEEQATALADALVRRLTVGDPDELPESPR